MEMRLAYATTRTSTARFRRATSTRLISIHRTALCLPLVLYGVAPRLWMVQKAMPYTYRRTTHTGNLTMPPAVLFWFTHETPQHVDHVVSSNYLLSPLDSTRQSDREQITHLNSAGTDFDPLAESRETNQSVRQTRPCTNETGREKLLQTVCLLDCAVPCASCYARHPTSRNNYNTFDPQFKNAK